MNIKVTMEDRTDSTAITGGGYAVCDLEVFIDKSLSERAQLEILLHEIAEGYLSTLDHSKIDELVELQMEGYDQWKGQVDEKTETG